MVVLVPMCRRMLVEVSKITRTSASFSTSRGEVSAVMLREMVFVPSSFGVESLWMAGEAGAWVGTGTAVGALGAGLAVASAAGVAVHGALSVVQKQKRDEEEARENEGKQVAGK